MTSYFPSPVYLSSVPFKTTSSCKTSKQKHSRLDRILEETTAAIDRRFEAMTVTAVEPALPQLLQPRNRIVKEETLLSSPVYRKESVRQMVWQRMRDNNSLQPFAHDPTSANVCRRIPYYRGALFAARRVTQLEEFQMAGAVAVGPSLSEKALRRMTLLEKKLLVVPELRVDSLPFMHLVEGHYMTRSQCSKAAGKGGAAKLGFPVGAREMRDSQDDPFPHIGVYVVGSVAVAENGVRIGMGCGYGELEWAVLNTLGLVSEDTLVVTMVHTDQIVSDRWDLPVTLARNNDLPVDAIVTPNEVIWTKRRSAKPRCGVVWDMIDTQMLHDIPILGEIKKSESALDQDFYEMRNDPAMQETIYYTD